MADMTLPGHCTCGAVRYRMMCRPLFTNCCHCRWCQRETGSAFAINALIETSNVVLEAGGLDAVLTPSESGRGQTIMRCPTCRDRVWSHYGMGPEIAFIRVGTLEQPDLLPPDVHIFTLSKQPWVRLPPETPAFEVYYDRRELWPEASLERLRVLRGG